MTDYNHGYLFSVSFCLCDQPWLRKKVRSDYARFYVQVCGLRSGWLYLIFAVNNQSGVLVLKLVKRGEFSVLIIR